MHFDQFFLFTLAKFQAHGFVIQQIGLMGLVEEEWIATLSTIDPEDITFIDYVEQGNLLAEELRRKVARRSS